MASGFLSQLKIVYRGLLRAQNDLKNELFAKHGKCNRGDVGFVLFLGERLDLENSRNKNRAWGGRAGEEREGALIVPSRLPSSREELATVNCFYNHHCPTSSFNIN